MVKNPFKRLSKFGRILFRLKVIRVYGNGDGCGCVWRMWNPLAWVVLILGLTAGFFCGGAKGIMEYWDDNRCMLTVTKYFKQHPDRLVWANTSSFTGEEKGE